MTKEPFLNKTTPELFFESKIHKGAWSFLNASLKSEEPVVLLTGEYGTGKTLLCLKLVETLKQQEQPYVYISTPMQSYKEALRGICKSLHIEATSEDSEDSLHRLIYAFFERNPDHTLILLLDDAQEHNSKALNKVRMLVNYNVEGRNPIRLFLVGSPAFVKRLQAPDLEPLDQRIKRRYSMTGLNFIETKEYIYFRLLEAGATGSPFFPDDTIQSIVSITNGIPRRINNICDMCLQIATTGGIDTIKSHVVNEAVTYLGWQLNSVPLPDNATASPSVSMGTLLTSSGTRVQTPMNPPLSTAHPQISPPTDRRSGHFITPDEHDWTIEQQSNSQDTYNTGLYQEESQEQQRDLPVWAWRTAVFLLIIACIVVFFIRDIDASALVQQLLNQQ
ncbi:AAA family ATPase [Pontibacterium granulatum]|uniref:ExeA family protein n=1 Tax=Pontibacterium granulatum TaxID=2036029 RepID=UPI00249C9D47|nr:AAA family ATPase [Pontibacterium granulatum]MDI3325745.1 AAA family ATPase [Pontibacterium granulatum]